MTATDSAFEGSIPAAYDRYMVPMLFEPYAADLAARARAIGPGRLLEIAAGTGAVTRALAAALPGTEIVATDLSQPMIDVAESRSESPSISFRQADAMALPFGDGEFDAVLCQFGVMFFPNRVKAYREVRRVLHPGGHFPFNAWDKVERNQLTLVLADALAALFPDDPPDFFRRIPFGYSDTSVIRADLAAAGFGGVVIETVGKASRIGSARDAALGMCFGSPMRAELEERAPGRLGDVVELVAAAIGRVCGTGGIDAPMSAHVVSARA